MKYFSVLVVIISLLFLFTACNNADDASNIEAVSSEEISSILESDELSNADKSDYIHKLAEAEQKRANVYREKIKSLYEERINSFSEGYESIGFSLDEAYQSLDDYCNYLEKEYESNTEFFDDFAAVKYHTGSVSSLWKARKEYECAKNYADKMESLYEDIK